MSTEFRFMPEQASSFAKDVDSLYLFLVVVSTVMSVLIAALIVFFAIKYRQGSPADRRRGATHFFWLELSWIILPFPLMMAMFYVGARLFFEQTRPPAAAMEIACVAKQWMWKFQHPEGNAEINDLHVPIHQPVKLTLISEDVIHSFYVPAFRVKQDVLPGRYTTVWFEATKLGEYHLFCAEYCGAKHSEMGGRVVVMKQHEYQAWLSDRAAQAVDSTPQSLLDELRCSGCHLPAPARGRGPSLENVFGSQVRLQDGRTVLADENYLRESILRPAAKVVTGYPNIMPPYEGQISEEQMLRLIGEIKALSKPVIVDPEADKPTTNAPAAEPTSPAAQPAAADTSPNEPQANQQKTNEQKANEQDATKPPDTETEKR